MGHTLNTFGATCGLVKLLSLNDLVTCSAFVIFFFKDDEIDEMIVLWEI